jgi:predicted nucleic acid-binding Zn ribbon protein
MADNIERIPQHRHCDICGKAFVGDGRFCSNECKESKGAEAKSKLKKYLVIEVVLVAVVIIALFASGVF